MIHEIDGIFRAEIIGRGVGISFHRPRHVGRIRPGIVARKLHRRGE